MPPPGKKYKSNRIKYIKGELLDDDRDLNQYNRLEQSKSQM